jgi:asparagine synthase (glutamine-hydrolysing)
VIWDARRQCLIATNDRFGMRPAYYVSLPARLLVASEIKAFFADPAVPRDPSLRGISQFFTYGQYLGEDTSFEAIRVLPAAGWLEWDVEKRQVALERYWAPEDAPKHDCSTKEWLERIDEAFARAVQCRTEGTPGLGIALSGGLDARTILGVMDHRRADVTSVALGIEGCADHRSASQLAALVNCRHHNYLLRGDFLARFQTHLCRMVHLTDGQYLSQCIVMPTLPFYRQQGIQVLLRGHAGELMHMNKAYNFSLDRRALRIASERELEDWAFGHLRAYMLGGVDGPLLARHCREDLDTLAQESLRECLAQSAGISPQVQRIWHLFLTQRSRRETALALVKFGSLLEVRLPYLDNQVVELLLSAPPELKMGETIQGHILRKRRPEFLDVVNINTGTRMGAGRMAQAVAGFKQKVFSKLRVRGYQPYERLGLWLRRELRPLVEDVLLADRCLDRGIFHPDTVRGVVRHHCEGKRNHTFLLMALMIFELGQRAFIDQKAMDEPAVAAEAP